MIFCNAAPVLGERCR